MADKYTSFEALRKERVEGRDYRIVVEHEGRSRSVAVIAPHAGKIEPVTSMLAREIARDDYCLYLFEGIMEGSNFAELHITSINFDEPQALQIVSQCTTALAIHGRRDDADPHTIWLGGFHGEMIAHIERELRSYGFSASSNGHRFPATDPENICNRGRSGGGVQIEVPKTLRQTMRSNEALRRRFVDAVREPLSEVAEL